MLHIVNSILYSSKLVLHTTLWNRRLQKCNCISIILIILMIVLKRTVYYGLKKVSNLKKYIYFIPLLLIISVNLYNKSKQVKRIEI